MGHARREELSYRVSDGAAASVPGPKLIGDDQQALPRGIGVDPCAIALTGSSSVGISLNPAKEFKEFHRRSDIDVAVISSYHFEMAWRRLRTLGSEYFRLGPETRRSVDEHRKTYIYYGTIATDQILGLLPFGRAWQAALSRTATIRSWSKISFPVSCRN